MISKEKFSNLRIFFLVFIATIIFYRVAVILIGDRSVYIFDTEIHHLYFGIIFLIISGFIRFFSTNERLNKLDLIAFSIGTGTVIDEFIYIIFTPGDHYSYYSNVSIFGMIISTVVLIILLYFIFRRVADGKK